MSKSVIIIDTPINCTTCPLSNYNGYTRTYYCGGTGEYSREIEDFKWQREKPEWCPLSSLPSNRETMQRKDVQSFADALMYMYDKGWNDCIYFILKENE